MKNIIKNIVCMTFLSLAFVGVVANADIYNQNFDTWTGAPQSGYTSSTDSSGWSAVLTKIQGEVMFGIIPFSEPYMAVQTGRLWIQLVQLEYPLELGMRIQKIILINMAIPTLELRF
jgi:hypothetical protein